MTHYSDVILSTAITLGTSSGPRTLTKKLYTTSGNRKANQQWDQKLRRLNLKFGVRLASDLYEVLEIYEAVDGPANTFLARDPNDWNSTEDKMGPGQEDQVFTATQNLKNSVTNLFVGDGSTTNFIPIKRYQKGATAISDRTLFSLTDDSSLVIEVDGVPQGSGDYTFNTDGSIEFSVAPGASLTTKWGGKFNMVVAFESDDFIQNLDNVGFSGEFITSVPNIPVEEIRNPF